MAPTDARPKQFKAVDINRRFFAKNIAVAAAAAAAVTKPSVASGPSQTAHAHSRLVSTKLTGAPGAAASTAPGWSRPTSTTPSSTTSSPLPSAPPLPQPSKPAWRFPKSTPLPAPTNDFPTAAEVAQGRSSKHDPSASVPKHQSHEADTFRGLHLDPNAHHWDEVCSNLSCIRYILLLFHRWRRTVTTFLAVSLNSATAGNTKSKPLSHPTSLSPNKIVLSMISTAAGPNPSLRQLSLLHS